MAALSMANGTLAPAQRQGTPPYPPLLHSSFLGSPRLRISSGRSLRMVSNLRPALQQQQQRSWRGVVSMSFDAGIGILGTKVGMMTHFMPDGRAIPVTVIGFHEGNIVTQIKTQLKDGYDAIQIGYQRVRDRKLTKPEMGHLKKIDCIPLRHLREFRLVNIDGFELNQRLQMEEIFKVGDLVDISGRTIGKGFQGGIKRHNFKRGQMTHGSKSHRELGSIGAGTTPGRVYPGKKMPGRMGFEMRKIRKLEIIKIDPELRAMLVKGAVPGKQGNLLRIAPAKIVGVNIPKN